jgi:DeoR/GlpR family transcriptional regulator of sugar metabolism
MLAEQRHQYILAQVTRNGALSVAELVRELNVSRETIRRDLNTLASRGLIVTTHGGALSSGLSANARPNWYRTAPRSSSTRAAPRRPWRAH